MCNIRSKGQLLLPNRDRDSNDDDDGGDKLKMTTVWNYDAVVDQSFKQKIRSFVSKSN